MKASDLLVRCLENEGVEYIWGIPGEETLDFMDSLSRSTQITFVPTRHEQGAAFIGDVLGRLTGRAGVCLATLGPGATNALTGVADAYLDRSPLVVLTGQVPTPELHKESHQNIDIVQMFRPVTKWNTRLNRPDVLPEVIRKAFRVAQMEKPGATHVELPDNIIQMETDAQPMPITSSGYSVPNPVSVQRAVEILKNAKRPMILAGNGVIRRRASPHLRQLAEKLDIPVTNTFMGKGNVDYNDDLAMSTVGLTSRDLRLSGLDRADVVLCVGYDLVEYAPVDWNPDKKKCVLHVDTLPAEVDSHYNPEVEIVSDIGPSLDAIAGAADFTIEYEGRTKLRDTVQHEMSRHADDTSFPLKPQKVLADLRSVLDPEDILVSDTGAHKLWIARMFPAYNPNTVIISNGLATMGIAVPGAIAAKMVYPDRNVVAVSGDGGFMMNSQELETAKRLGTAFVTVLWVDGQYGSIDYKQRNKFGHAFGTGFTNPDFVKYAESFGLPAWRVTEASELQSTLRKALAANLPSVVEVPVDYRENLTLSAKLGESAAIG